MSERIIAFNATDLPDPVVPATSTSGRAWTDARPRWGARAGGADAEAGGREGRGGAGRLAAASGGGAGGAGAGRRSDQVQDCRGRRRAEHADRPDAGRGLEGT